MTFTVKPKALDKIVNREIADLYTGIHTATRLCIFDDGDVQVQILVTREEDDHIDIIVPDYEEATE